MKSLSLSSLYFVIGKSDSKIHHLSVENCRRNLFLNNFSTKLLCNVQAQNSTNDTEKFKHVIWEDNFFLLIIPFC